MSHRAEGMRGEEGSHGTKGRMKVDCRTKECPLFTLFSCRRYEDVFPEEVPPKLPPNRGIEHQIDLVHGALLPNRAAYRTNPEETK